MEIYTDASLKGKNFGLGILYINNKDLEIKLSFGKTYGDIHNEFGIKKVDVKNPTLIEGLTILKSLQLLCDDMTTDKEDIVLYTDSLIFYEFVNSYSKSKNENINRIIEVCVELMKEKDVDVRWIRGHVGVYGNEIADELARKGRVNIEKEIKRKNKLRK